MVIRRNFGLYVVVVVVGVSVSLLFKRLLHLGKVQRSFSAGKLKNSNSSIRKSSIKVMVIRINWQALSSKQLSSC